MNQKAQKKAKAVNPKGKPTREEIQVALQPLLDQANRTLVGLCVLTDFLGEKGFITTEEFAEYFKKRTTPPPAEAPTAVPLTQ